MIGRLHLISTGKGRSIGKNHDTMAKAYAFSIPIRSGDILKEPNLRLQQIDDVEECEDEGIPRVTLVLVALIAEALTRWAADHDLDAPVLLEGLEVS